MHQQVTKCRDPAFTRTIRAWSPWYFRILTRLTETPSTKYYPVVREKDPYRFSGLNNWVCCRFWASLPTIIPIFKTAGLVISTFERGADQIKAQRPDKTI